jgi:hypothetical protein
MDNTFAGAQFSPCRNYRYALWRIWDKDKPKAMFVGLNPSTANETKPDNTIKRVVKIARNWGCGGIYMVNLFSIISADPKILKTCPDPQMENDGWLVEISKKCERVVFAWGAFKEAKGRCNQVIAMFPNAYALEILKDGSPKHPLYCKGDTVPVPYRTTNPLK